MKSELLLEFIEASNEVVDDMETLNKLFEKDYFNIEIYTKIKNNMIQRLCDIKTYYDNRS